MKKLSFLLIAFAINTGANAQGTWNVGPAGGIRCVTRGNVGIETPTDPSPFADPITDARLHIFGGGTGLPELKISRPSISPTTPNFFEIWKTPSTTPIDVINRNGFLGILNPAPSMPLDVMGNGIIRGNATVTNDLFVRGGDVDLGMPMDGSWRTVQAHTLTGGINVIANDATTGPFISMFGMTFPALVPSGEVRAGQIFYNAYGKSGIGHRFMNYDGSTYHTNAWISDAGQMVVGQDVFTIAPGDVLTVNNTIGFHSFDATSARSIHGNAPSGVLGLAENTGPDDGSFINIYGKDNADASRQGSFYYTSYSTSTQSYGHLFLTYDPSTTTHFDARMGIEKNGKVVIGEDLLWSSAIPTPTPDGYLLYVEKGILTEKLKVANSSDGANWSDFVFNKDYDLMPLSKVESYVKTNKHLPEIPSASEVAKDGIDVASMDAKLLRKIEELMLYVIEQQKEIDELKKQQKR